MSDSLLRAFGSRSDVAAIPVANYDGGTRARRLYMGLSAAATVVRLRKRISIVHLQVTTGLSIERELLTALIARSLRLPVVTQFHGAGQQDDYRKGPAVHRLMYRTLIGVSDAILILGTNGQRWISAIRPSARTAIVPNFVSLHRDQETPPAQPPAVLFVGRLGQRKGVYDLLSALELLAGQGCVPPTWFVGDGELSAVRTRIERSEALSGSVTVLGWKDQSTVTELMMSSTALVLPSYAEGLPLAILEAMALGRAVIATRVGDVEDAVVDGENGILLSPGDVPGLANAIREMVTHPVRAAEMGRAGLARSETLFTPEKVVEDLIGIYEGVTHASSRHGSSGIGTNVGDGNTR